MSLPTLGISQAEYRRRFADPNFGLDLAQVVADRCALRGPLIRQVEGSNLVFKAGGELWLKISPPFWPDAFEAELAATKAVQGNLPVPIPSIVKSGALEDWRYLISTHVPGVQIQAVLPSLTEADLERIAAELGQFMRAFHAVVAPSFERAFGPWARHLDERLAGARELHLSGGVDPARVEQIMALLAARAPELRTLGPPVLIHADLTGEHVMLVERAGRWRLSGILDLADAMRAPAALDLVSPIVELFFGRRAPQRRLIEESGALVGEAPFSEALMAVALQHRFVHFDAWFATQIKAGFTDVADIARAVFPD